MKENKPNHAPNSITRDIIVQVWQDKADFIRTYFDRWLNNEAEEAPFLRLNPQTMPTDALCISLDGKAGNTLQTAVFTPNDQIILSSGTDESIYKLCHYLAEHNHNVLGIFAPNPTSQLVAKRLEELTDKPYQLVKQLLHMELEQLIFRGENAGIFQPATPQNLSQIAAHRTALQAESNTQRPFDSMQSVQIDLQNGMLYKWVDNTGQIVTSGSLYHDYTPASAYINHVYVPPVHRRQGYASALVTNMCQLAMARGKTPRLSVDAMNQPAYQAYLKMGFVVAGCMDNFRAK